MKAWYFSTSDCILRYGDGRQIEAGITHSVDCKPVLRRSGLHGSVNILDALKYAPGPYVWRVNLSGEIVKGDDKCSATSREYLWGFDSTEVLRKFARMCALDVAHLWDCHDAVLKYLKTGDDSLRAEALAAARDAAWAAARDAARDAAWAAARDAARDAAWAAARAAARDAAWAEAWDAAWAAARDSQSKRLSRMIMESRP